MKVAWAVREGDGEQSGLAGWEVMEEMKMGLGEVLVVYY